MSTKKNSDNDMLVTELGNLRKRVKEAEAHRAQDREAHLKQVLLAIRNVNQLITTETDPKRLIERACANLTETLGYYNAWIAMMDEAGVVVTMTACSGFDCDFALMQDRLERGAFPSCMRCALGQDALLVVEDPPTDCPDCPLACEYAGRAGLTRRLAFGGRVHGILSVSVPGSYAHDAEEQDLFNEVAGDLAFALHKIEETEMLWESENKMRSIFRAAPIGIGVVSDRVILEVNERCCEITGYSKDELIGKSARILYPTDEDYEYVGREKYRQIEERRTRTVETRFKRKDGKIIYVLLSSTPLDPADLSAGVTFTAFDITERKQAEEALMRQQRAITLNNRIANVFLASPAEEIYTDVLEVILEALDSRFGYFGFIDDAGNLVCPSMTRDVWDRCHVAGKSMVFPRASWCGLWGRSLIEKRTLMANGDLRLPEGQASLESALAVPVVHRGKLIGQFVVANKPGGYGPDDRDLLESAAAQSAPVLSALLEETRQRRRHEKLEERYRQAQKMESIGRLAGGVAHDLNNLLSPILGYGEMLLEDVAGNDPRREPLEEIVSAGMRARDLVRQLLAFSRKQTLEFKPVDLNALLRKFERLLRRTIREDVAIKLIPAESLPFIRGDIGQLEQVVMNLAVNAHDAMPDGGELTIETARVELDESYASEHEGVTPGSYVMLVFSDTGCGMDAEARQHLFEPFFTTKGKEKGIGLGLSTVYGIVKQHGGNIWIYSEPGQGAIFKVYLPVSTESPGTKERASRTPTELHGSETILLVEDDEQVRNLALAILKRKGYTVLAAEGGKEALAILDRHDGPMRLLLTDVVMPEMNGKQLFERVAGLYPDIKALYMSGYTDNVLANRGVMDAGVYIIQKPFSGKALAAKVRETLDQ